MPIVILFVGLPGSGKTYYANIMCDVVVDDIVDTDQLPEEFDILGITDVNFCDANILQNAINILSEKYKTDINVVYFENNPDKCRKNVKYRDDGRNVEGTICRFENIYYPPENAIKIKNLGTITNENVYCCAR